MLRRPCRWRPARPCPAPGRCGGGRRRWCGEGRTSCVHRDGVELVLLELPAPGVEVHLEGLLLVGQPDHLGLLLAAEPAVGEPLHVLGEASPELAATLEPAGVQGRAEHLRVDVALAERLIHTPALVHPASVGDARQLGCGSMVAIWSTLAMRRAPLGCLGSTGS